MTFVSRDEYLSYQEPVRHLQKQKQHIRHLALEDNLEMADDDSKHHMTPKIRLAIYSFFYETF